MKLVYENKKDEENILKTTETARLETLSVEGEDTINKIIQGENISVMKTMLDSWNMRKQIDLVYIDPPFATNFTYKYHPDRTATISSCDNDIIAYQDRLTGEKFLEFLRERLIFIRELMSDHSSIYLHIDYKIGHYVKIIMDEIFGSKNFRNDISRIKCNPKNFKRKGYSNIRDLILFYSKNDDFTWNEPMQKMTGNDVEKLFKKVDGKGRRYTTTPLHAPGETKNGNTGKPWKGLMPPKGRHWRYDPSELDKLEEKGLIEWSGTGNPRKIVYAEDAKKKGKRMQDIWEFKDEQYPDYPTQKNLELLETIINVSSNPGQTVLDCFCGSGTTLVAAENLGRKWIGIDNSEAAIQTAMKRLKSIEGDLFRQSPSFEFIKQITP